MEGKNEVLELSFRLALLTIEFSENLEEKRKYIIARQLLKSGTSVGANVREAQSCESKRDFIHKLKIAHKEAEETEYWLLLCEKSKTYESPSEEIKQVLLSVQKLLSKIIYSTRLNLNN
ncbi:four helix bundle protein [Salegentibacter sp. Hel_I_6]|uniref:four helix bundle protein n=1 Tax=Salegentibacter sp. Hel_I_6 TaxID=1250278 RepID=UPI000AE5E5C1|nr:four helix bundle protein [Salegentibacter sp. Hel_I_6]